MSERRDKAIAQETDQLADRARYLRRLSRDHPDLSAKLHEAHGLLDDARQLANEGVEEATVTLADLTASSPEALRARAVSDDDALCELGRRGQLPVAA